MHTSGVRHDALKRRSGPKSKTSCYLGVTQYKRTGRWEAHIWCAADPESGDPEHRKGRQLHLGSFPAAIPAAIAYDRAAHIIKPRNVSRNFPNTDYSQDDFILQYGHLSKLEFVSKLRIWAQDPALAAEYLGFGRRPEPPVPKHVVLKHSALQHAVLASHHSLQAPLRESRAAAAVLAMRPPEPVPSPQRPAPATPLPPLSATGRACLPLPVAAPVTSRRPRSRRYTCARPNIQPVKQESSPATGPSDEELEELRTSPDGPAPAMALLLMAMKAAEEAPSQPDRPQPLQPIKQEPQQQQLKQQQPKQQPRPAFPRVETAAENMRRRRHPEVQPRRTWHFQELPESFATQPLGRPLVAGAQQPRSVPLSSSWQRAWGAAR